jgi:hypothetical protein
MVMVAIAPLFSSFATAMGTSKISAQAVKLMHRVGNLSVPASRKLLPPIPFDLTET